MSIEHSITIACTPEHIFAIYKDVDSWAQWDPDIEAVGMNGEFAVGTTGWLKPVGAPKTATQMVSVDAPSSFTVESRLPLCKMTFQHELQVVDEGTLVTHRVLFSGPLAGLYSWLVGSKIKKGIKGTMEGLKQYAQNTP